MQAPGAEGHGMRNMRSIFVVAGMLAVVGLSFIGGIVLGEKQGMEKAEYAGKKRLLQRIETQRHELDILKKKDGGQKHRLARMETQVGDLTFYNTLPNQKVAPAPLGTSQNSLGHEGVAADIIRHGPAHRRTQPVPGGAFRLQVGSYHRKADADNLKKQFKQQGLRAVVEKTVVPGMGLWFRVYTGPYANRRMAGQARLRVQTTMHITGLLLHD